MWFLYLIALSSVPNTQYNDAIYSDYVRPQYYCITSDELDYLNEKCADCDYYDFLEKEEELAFKNGCAHD